MRKYIIILCLVLVTSSISAQDNKDVSFHVKAGYLHSNLVGKDKGLLASDHKINPYNSFFIGLQVDNPISSILGFKHEISYQNYGAKFVRDLNERPLDAKLIMHGIFISPISISANSFGIEVYLGPYVNLLVNSSITAVDNQGRVYKDYEIFGSSSNDQDSSGYLQKMDYGVVAGIGYSFSCGVSLGARYSRGFASIIDNANAYENENRPKASLYTSNLAVFLSYKL